MQLAVMGTYGRQDGACIGGDQHFSCLRQQKEEVWIATQTFDTIEVQATSVGTSRGARTKGEAPVEERELIG